MNVPKKVSNGVTKFLLKKLCYKYLPHEIVTRKKKGFEEKSKEQCKEGGNERGPFELIQSAAVIRV